MTSTQAYGYLLIELKISRLDH